MGAKEITIDEEVVLRVADLVQDDTRAENNQQRLTK